MTTTKAFYAEVRAVIAQTYRTMRNPHDESAPVKNRNADRAAEQKAEHTPTDLERDEITDDMRRKAVQSVLLVARGASGRT